MKYKELLAERSRVYQGMVHNVEELRRALLYASTSEGSEGGSAKLFLKRDAVDACIKFFQREELGYRLFSVDGSDYVGYEVHWL